MRASSRHARIFDRAVAQDNCESPDPANTITDRLNKLLNTSGPGYVLRLCPGRQYMIQAPILFAAPDQEISTLGYPTGDDRATLVVVGPVVNGTGHTVAVDGTCSNCQGARLRNIQINGTRAGAPSTKGGANIEMGGNNPNQLIEYVRSYDPRSWSCLHIQEGGLRCTNATVRNNDIGPCGSDAFQQWADGISIACRDSVVTNNLIRGPTDGGIVLFGSPGTLVENNTIWAENQILLGGINLVDYDPWHGDYTDTVVNNNTIAGGFSTHAPNGPNGTHHERTIIKIGIAIGPRTWFGNRYLRNVSTSGMVTNNKLTGAFSYGIAISSASDFTVTNNALFGNTSFIGVRGPNCSRSDNVPTPAPFIMDMNTLERSTMQADFESVPDGDSLTCVMPPDDGDLWPSGGNPDPRAASSVRALVGGTPASAETVIGVLLGVSAGLALALLVRKWARMRRERKKYMNMARFSTTDHGRYD